MSSSKLNKTAAVLVEIAAQRAVKPCCIRFKDCLIGVENDTVSGFKASWKEVDLSKDGARTSRIGDAGHLFFGHFATFLRNEYSCHQTYCYLNLDSDLDLSDKYIVAHNVAINLNNHELKVGGIIANVILASNGTVKAGMVTSMAGLYSANVHLTSNDLVTNDLSVKNSTFVVEKWDSRYSRFSSLRSVVECKDDGAGHSKVYHNDVGSFDSGSYICGAIHDGFSDGCITIPVNYGEYCFDSYLVEREYRKLVNEASGKVAESKQKAKVASERDLVIKALVGIGAGIMQDIPLLITRSLDKLCKFDCTSEVCKEYPASVGYADLSAIVNDVANRAVLIEKLVTLIGIELDLSEDEFEAVVMAMTQSPSSHTTTKTQEAGGKKANASAAAKTTTVQQPTSKASHTCYFGKDNADKGLEYLIQQLNKKNVELSKLKITFNLDDTGDSRVVKMADTLISSATLDPKASKELTEYYKNHSVPGGMDNVVINVINLYTKLFSL